MKILMVDDDASARMVLGELLEHAGHEVVTATGGHTAWAALQRDYFPLMLLDRVMPDLDGIELCRRIRARRQTRYTYVILVTMVGGKEPYLEGMNAGADDYFSKPFDPDELMARVRVAE
ncbi:MAG TPA: response regulator transcription factor, partial [Verrucomicrobiae bacterium]|nr:response regulator transcription factor [Verrucomicrobiae bacterium]